MKRVTLFKMNDVHPGDCMVNVLIEIKLVENSAVAMVSEVATNVPRKLQFEAMNLTTFMTFTR